MYSITAIYMTCKHRYTERNKTERHVAASTCFKRLRITVKQFDLFENAMVWLQYPGRNTTSMRLNQCNRFSEYRGSLAERRNKKRTICLFSDLQMWCFSGALQQRSPAMLSVLLLMKTIENYRYGLQKLMTKFRAEF